VSRNISVVLPMFALVIVLSGCGDDDTPLTSDGGVRTDGAMADLGTTMRDGGGMPSSFLRCPPVSADTTTGAALPRERVDTSFPVMSGRTIRVEAGGNLQAALDMAVGGDTVELAAGATFMGPLTLRARPGTDWIVIRSDGAALPAEGRRVAPSDAATMARIVAPAGLPAISADASANHVRFVGIELTTSSDAFSYALADLGSSQTTVATMPHHMVFDRCYLHGAATAGTRRGIAMNGIHIAVIESYFTDFREVGADSQAICGWSGPGPFGIYDNYLAGAGENIMFGGASSHGPGTNPADIEVCGNHFDKPLSWYEMDPSYAGLNWVNKNIFELKNARRVLLAGNVLEHSWGDGQVGFAILLTPRAEGNTALDHAVTDVTIAYNVIRDVGAGISLSSVDDGTAGSNVSERIVLTHNLLIGVDGARWNGAGRGFQVTRGGATGHDVLIAHNTARISGNAAIVFGDSTPIFDGVVIRDNLLEHASYGVFGSGEGAGMRALEHYVPGYVFTANAIFGDAAAGSAYPAGNFFPADAAAVGFVDLAGGDYALAPSSAYASSATDGGPLGADVAMISRITATVR